MDGGINAQELAPFLSLAAFFTGIGKAGITALGGLVTPILILPLPNPRTAVSLGTLLFFVGDVGAVCYYARRVRLLLLWRILPIAALGMLAAFVFGRYIPTRPYMLSITLLSAAAFALLLYSERQKNREHKHAATPQPAGGAARHRAVLLSAGLLAGFTTVLGNVSGIYMSLYLSALRLPKQGFVSTLALFYVLGNGAKLLGYYFYWHSLQLYQLRQLAPYAPVVVGSLVLGLLLGIWAVHKMSERLFFLFVVLASLVSLLLLLWRTAVLLG